MLPCIVRHVTTMPHIMCRTTHCRTNSTSYLRSVLTPFLVLITHVCADVCPAESVLLAEDSAVQAERVPGKSSLACHPESSCAVCALPLQGVDMWTQPHCLLLCWVQSTFLMLPQLQRKLCIQHRPYPTVGCKGSCTHLPTGWSPTTATTAYQASRWCCVITQQAGILVYSC